jgi:hypothetical protein
MLSSCKHGIKFKVKNRSELLIEKAIITNGVNDVKLKNLANGKTKTLTLDFSNNKLTNDGSYGIKVKFSDRVNLSKKFGYFSNGLPSDSRFEINVTKDTIIVSEKEN